jgi:hypothetical protein
MPYDIRSGDVQMSRPFVCIQFKERCPEWNRVFPDALQDRTRCVLDGQADAKCSSLDSKSVKISIIRATYLMEHKDEL